MIALKPVLSETSFSKDAIRRQLNKIVTDPIFDSSDILKRFLLFIVGETLEENTNKLKEYTIAIKVLNKPLDFKPQDSGIVRIHAGRLRRALNFYYGQKGLLDPIRISIPKGSYVPTFDNNEDDAPSRMLSSRKSITVGILPFKCRKEKNESVFTDGLAVQLSKALMSIEDFSVVAYCTTKGMSEKHMSVEEIASSLGAKFLVAGDVQVVNKNLRVYLQLIRTKTNQLVWSQMYDRKFIPNDIFLLQDDLATKVVAELGALAI
ncbi:MAG TPA: hypothetical protein VG890_06750 [Puia sp.]|nr:hypothetical protein [Puia sp.]